MTTLRQALAVIQSHSHRAPVPVFEIAAMLGLGPEFRVLPDNISGKIVRSATSAGYTIVVNSSHHPNRQRFTVAHELGHYIYHRDLLQGGVGDTVAYRSEGSDTPNELIGPHQETEANRFASNILMPSHLISALQARGLDPKGIAKALGVSESALRIRLGLPPKTSLVG